MTSCTDEPDESDPAILEALSDIAGIIEVVAAKHLDRIDGLEDEVESQRDRIGVLKWEKDRDRTLLKDIKALVWKMPRAGTDTEIVAKIRGMLHG